MLTKGGQIRDCTATVFNHNKGDCLVCTEQLKSVASTVASHGTMVLESTIICCDNSNYQRNGDYIPTRLGAQTEAINLISLSKTRSHPENDVALMTIANSVEVLATLTSDIRRISMKMGKVSPKGDINLLTGLRIAQLVLKHRQSKQHRMRIVAFVGSPLESDIKEDLMNLAKRLKKEKVQVDIVSFGSHEGNKEILQDFIEVLNGKEGNGSHMIDVPRGNEIMTLLVHSPIVLGEDETDPTQLTTAYEYGVDPNEDPDLALALRISMEEERQRQEAERLRANAEEGKPQSAPIRDLSNMTEEQQIAYAMEMSMQPTEESFSSSSAKCKCCTLKKSKDKDKKKKK